MINVICVLVDEKLKNKNFSQDLWFTNDVHFFKKTRLFYPEFMLNIALHFKNRQASPNHTPGDSDVIQSENNSFYHSTCKDNIRRIHSSKVN